MTGSVRPRDAGSFRGLPRRRSAGSVRPVRMISLEPVSQQVAARGETRASRGSGPIPGAATENRAPWRPRRPAPTASWIRAGHLPPIPIQLGSCLRSTSTSKAPSLRAGSSGSGPPPTPVVAKGRRARDRRTLLGQVAPGGARARTPGPLAPGAGAGGGRVRSESPPGSSLFRGVPSRSTSRPPRAPRRPAAGGTSLARSSWRRSSRRRSRGREAQDGRMSPEGWRGDGQPGRSAAAVAAGWPSVSSASRCRASPLVSRPPRRNPFP